LLRRRSSFRIFEIPVAKAGIPQTVPITLKAAAPKAIDAATPKPEMHAPKAGPVMTVPPIPKAAPVGPDASDDDDDDHPLTLLFTEGGTCVEGGACIEGETCSEE
jgi:hypothetical protein